MEKQEIKYKGAQIKLADDIPAENLQGRRDWQEKFQVKENKDLQLCVFYTAWISIKMVGQIRDFLDKRRVKKIQLHQASLAGYSKVTDLRRGRKTVREKQTKVQRDLNGNK